MTIRFLTLVCVFLLTACGDSGSIGTGDVNPTTNVGLNEGNVTAVNEEQTYELQPAGGANVVEWRWSSNPVNAGALPACSAVDGFNPQLAAQRLDAACTQATQCFFDFDQKQSPEGDTTFALSVPALKAPIGLTYQLTAVNAAQRPEVANFTFCLIAINEAPSASSDVFVATEGTALNISPSAGLNLLSNDTDDIDLSNRPLRVNPTPVRAPSLAAEFSLLADGGFSYLYQGDSAVPAGQTLTDSFDYEITDGFNQSTATVTINIGTSDKPPRAIDSIPDQSVTAGVEKPFDLSTFFVDPENGELIFAAVGDTLPTAGSLSISELGVFAGTAGAGDAGEYTVRFTVSDQVSVAEAASAPLAASFKLVVNPNLPPTVSDINDSQFVFGELISLQLEEFFSDPEAQSLKFSAQTEPSSALQINESSGLLTGQLGLPGIYLVTVSADDGINNPVTQTFAIRQLPAPNLKPVLDREQPDVETTVGVPMTPITAAFTDPENKPMVFAINTLPAGLAFDPATGELSGTPSEPETYSLIFSATDSEGAITPSNTFMLQVNPVVVPNRPPAATLIIESQVIKLGASIEPATAAFKDLEGDDITHQISPSVLGLAGYAFDADTGTLTGTPGQAVTTEFTIFASDGEATAESNPFTITVNENKAPVQMNDIADQMIEAGNNIVAINGNFEDPDGDSLSYTIEPPIAGSGLLFDTATGTLTGVPVIPDDVDGSLSFQIRAFDGLAATLSNPFTIQVDQPPEIFAPVQLGMIADLTIDAGVTISPPIKADFTDADSPILTYTLSSPVGDTGLVFDPVTGTLGGTPKTPGMLTYTIAASDGLNSTESNEFVITVNAVQVNRAPVPGPAVASQTVAAGQLIDEVDAGFMDLDGDELSFSIKPAANSAGLQFDKTSGLLTGAPTVVKTHKFVITADDGNLKTSAPEFTIIVTPEELPPLLLSNN